MGTKIGHIGPGFGFFAIGLWHLYNHTKLYARQGSTKYRSLPWFPSPYLLRHLELYLIMIGTIASVSMELFIGPQRHQPLDPDGTIPSNHLHNLEHASISLTFLVYSTSALILDTTLMKGSGGIPRAHDILQLVGSVAFAQQLLLFHLHSADHMGVEGQYHWLLQLVIFVSLCTTLLGIGRPRRFFVSYVRSLSIMFQGVWLIVMGYMLWTPALIPKGCFMHVEEGHMVVRCDGEESLHRAKALVNIQFSWFLIALAVFAVSFYVLVMRCSCWRLNVAGAAAADEGHQVKYMAFDRHHHHEEEEDDDEEEDVDLELAQHQVPGQQLVKQQRHLNEQGNVSDEMQLFIHMGTRGSDQRDHVER